jgi:Zn-finger nucleic acid-binding protein
MKCPKCGTTLVKKSYKGMMEVDCCPNCRGMWLDFEELDRLEEFQYRLYDLRLDTCQNGHGFWLDAGEDVRVMGIMATRAAEVQRKVDAETEWRGFLKQMHAFFVKK